MSASNKVHVDAAQDQLEEVRIVRVVLRIAGDVRCTGR